MEDYEKRVYEISGTPERLNELERLFRTIQKLEEQTGSRQIRLVVTGKKQPELNFNGIGCAPNERFIKGDGIIFIKREREYQNEEYESVLVFEFSL